MKDQCDYYRRKEERLRVIKQKIDLIEGERDQTTSEEQRDALRREAQNDYEKYVKDY